MKKRAVGTSRLLIDELPMYMDQFWNESLKAGRGLTVTRCSWILRNGTGSPAAREKDRQ
ncbi:MAG: hypothetical protein QNK14_05240 [Desulfobacterales bacterium]|nr:hypothetical protein [Desulfobacterales bacterium]